MKPAASRSRHGLHALKARVKVKGLSAIDRRTAAGRSLVEQIREWIEAQGGDQIISPQRRTLTNIAGRTLLYIDSLDAWLVAQPSLVNARRKSVLPVLRERQQLVDSLARLLGQLGLERTKRPLPTLRETLTARASSSSAIVPLGGA